MNEPLVYLSGKLIPESQAGLKVYDAGIVLGATTTEMTRTFGKELFRIEDHVDRLFRSLKYMDLDIGLSRQDVIELSVEITTKNAALIAEDAELGLIHFVTPGEFSAYAGSAAGQQSMKPTVCMHTFPMPFQLWAEYFRTGIHVITPSTRHVPPQCVDPKMKNRSRMHWYLADRETHLSDPKAITLLLDLEGNITETSGANFLIVRDGKVLSPTLRNILPGVSRQQVIEICIEEGIEFLEQDLQIHDVANADEAFLSTTPYCMAPCTRINGIQIGNGTPGPIYHRLIGAWSKKVGLDVVKQVLGEL
ncbi:MAG: branched-chain amino acid aminotransferase [Candidatus Latescibacteria bacterium]|jgi:branched-chain amino acid aminotransferase|nr:branched-chain amino acid aminotransferase [Candidatus Latescibacterota bacterium]